MSTIARQSPYPNNKRITRCDRPSDRRGQRYRVKFSAIGQFLCGDSGILQLMDDLGAALDQNREIYMLGGGNPARIPKVQAFVRSCLEETLFQPHQFDELVGNYDAPQGNAKFIDSIASLLRSECGWPVGRENIAVTNGSQSSFFTLFNLFAGLYPDGSQRRILLPLTPEYIGYGDIGLGQELFYSCRPNIEIRGQYEFKYHVDFDQLDIQEGTGAICISRPTNPTGNVITDDEIRALREIAAGRDIPLIIDGAYGAPFPNIIFTEVTPIWDPGVIVCLSLSKLGLPGVRTGIVVADDAIIRAVTSANAIVSLSPGSFGPVLVTEAIRSGELLKISTELIRPYYQHHVDQAAAWIREQFAGYPCRIHTPEGAIFLWLWFQDLPITSDELYQRLKRRGVLVIAGEHFFPGLTEDWPHRHECIRVSYAQDPSMVHDGIQIIAEEVRLAYDQRKTQTA